MKNRYEKKYRGRPVGNGGQHYTNATHRHPGDFTFPWRADRARAEESAREKFKRAYERMRERPYGASGGRRFGEEPARTRQPCPHSVLGVPCDASLQVLRSAYRRLAKSVHPDLGSEDEREARNQQMARLNRAYEAAAREIQ